MTATRAEGAAPEAAAHMQKVEVDWGPERLERSLSSVHQRRARRSRAALVGAGAACVLAAAALLLFVFGRGAPPVAPPTRAPLAASGHEEPKTTFADGSVARVSPGGELLVKLAGAEHVESVLTRGAADFEVTKNPRRDFVVVAGTVRVRVVGTRFRVERSGERTRVSVTQGKVEVQEGDTKTYLEAGESRFFPSEPATTAVEQRPVASGARARFLELARGGDFKAAYQIMSQSPAAVGSSAEDLMLAADAARLSSHPEQALGYLRRVTSEHAGDSRAPLAAFTQGRVLLSQLSRPAEAAEAFALSRRLRPAGGLAEDALAREAEARAASGQVGPARALAVQYLSGYPQGKHAENMRRLTTSK